MTRWGSWRSGGLRQLRSVPGLAIFAWLLACLMLAPTTASAQTPAVVTATATGRATIVAPLTLIKIDDMNFAKIAPRPTAGTVVLDPATNVCTTTGAILQIGSCQAANFAGMGARRMTVRFQVTSTVNLTGPGQPMVLDTMVVDTSPDLTFIGGNGNGLGNGNRRYRIDSPSGIFTIQVGGTLRVNANQAPGIYTGTFNLTVQYN